MICVTIPKDHLIASVSKNRQVRKWPVSYLVQEVPTNPRRFRLGLSPFRFSQMNQEYKRVPDKHQLGNLLKVFERSHGRGKAIEKALRRWGMPD